MLKNFLWQREDEPQNMLTYIFLFINFIYGITFTFFPTSDVVTRSAFYMNAVPHIFWGSACLLLVFGTLYTIYCRPRRVGQGMGAFGVLVWSYGAALYALTGTYFAVLTLYVPQILFWTFWYIGVKRFYDHEDKINALIRK